MAGFISESQKQVIKSIVDRIHETFARDVVAYKFGQKVSFQTQESFNKLYKRSDPNAQYDLKQNSKVIKARIKYEKIDQMDFFQNNAQEKIVIPEGVVYLKVDEEGFLYMKDAKTVEFDGRTFSVQSPGQPLGMFGPHYYKFLLMPLE